MQRPPLVDKLDGIVEADETYVGGKAKGKRGRGASGKTSFLGLLERNGRVYTEIVPDCSKATLQPLFAVVLLPKLFSIVTADAATTALWMSDTRSITESITAGMSLLEVRTTLTALRVSGVLPNIAYRSFMGLHRILFTCT